MLFSATMPGAIVSLARTHMRHPMNIRAESGDAQQTVPATAQFIYQVHDLDKPEMIARILQAENSGLTIVFTRTKRAAQRVAEDLEDRGFDASPLHGDMQQVAREKALKKFREGKLRVLVATDVAARGIDVADVTHVINYSCPEDEKTYVHRIGRTGRAGATGIAVTFVDWADVTRWKVINKMLDLPFEDPAETYSTSEHFFHDMGIAPGTKGRLKPETPREPRSAPSAPGAAAPAGRVAAVLRQLVSSGGRSGDSGPREDRPRRDRSRSRTRSGEPVEASRPRQARPPPRSRTAARATPPAAAATVAVVAAAARRRPPRARRPTDVAPLGHAPGDPEDLTAPQGDLTVGSGCLSAPGREGRRVRRRRRPGCRPARSPTGRGRRGATAGCSRATAGVPSSSRVCTGAPSSTGMSWKPMAAFSPWVKRTMYLIVPESSTPTACIDLE